MSYLFVFTPQASRFYLLTHLLLCFLNKQKCGKKQQTCKNAIYPFRHGVKSSKHWSLILSFPLLYVFWLKLSSSCQWFPHGPLNRHNPKFSTWNSLTDFVCVSQTYTNEQTCDRFMCAFVGSLYASESLIRLPVSPCRRLLSSFLLSATCLDVLGQCIV